MNLHKLVSLLSLTVTTLVVTACGGGGGGGDMGPQPAANTAPTISAVADKTSDQDSVVGPIEFSIGDRESDVAALTVNVTADGASVVPADGIALGGSGASRTITLTPLEAATGTVNVRIAVTDPEGATSSRAFNVMVNARAASVRDWSLATFAKAEGDEATAM